MSATGWVVLGVLAVLLVWAVTVYNRLVQLRNRIANALGQIDVQLKRRYGLIPNLVETAKGYMKHERETLEAVIAARKKLVEGAVTMVEMALQHLSEKNVVDLDDERKAAMVSDLMVVLCGERDTQPVVNAGSLY